MQDETVWLNHEQLLHLFDRDTKHINNALKEELIESTIAKFVAVQKKAREM